MKDYFRASRLAPSIGGSCAGGAPCMAFSSSFLAVSYAPQIVHVMTPSAGLALVVRAPSPVVAIVAHAAEESPRREVLVVGGRCGRMWTVDVDRLTSMLGRSSCGRKRRRMHGAERSPNFRTEEGRGASGGSSGGVRLVVLRPATADMEYPGLRFALSLGATRGLLFAGLLNPATHVRYPRTPSEPVDASAVCGLSGELASAFLTVTPATATTSQTTAFATDRALMTRDFSVALFGVDAALSGAPLIVQSDSNGGIFWWSAPERPTRTEKGAPPRARRLNISGYAPFACPVVGILPLVPPQDTFCAASPPAQCCGLLLVGSSGECRLLTLDAHIPWDGRRRAASQLSPGAKTLNPAKNLVCVDISLAGPIGAVSAVPGSVVHINASTGQVLCTAAFAERDGEVADVAKTSDPEIVLDRALSTPLPFARRAVALGMCSASHHSTAASTPPSSSTSLVVLTDQGDIFGIKTHDLKHIASALWQFESLDPGRRASTPPSDGDNDASFEGDRSSEFPDTALESMMLGSERMVPIRRLRGPVAVQCRLEERLAMLRGNTAKATNALARRGTGITALVEVGVALDLAARVAQKVCLKGSNGRGKRPTVERRRQGWRCKSVLSVRGFSHEARVVDLDDTTRRGFRSFSGDVSQSNGGGGTADRDVFIRVTITADAATAELLSSSRCWSYTMNVSQDAPVTCNRLPQRHCAVSTPRCGHAVAIGPFRQIYRQHDSTEYFAWDICLPLRASLISSCFHLPIKLSFGLTSAYRRGCAWSERDDFSIALGGLKLDPLSLIIRRPQVIIDASPAGLRRGALSLRSSFMSTAALNGRLVPYDIFRVTQQVPLMQHAPSGPSIWMQLQDALNAFDINMDMVQLANGDRSAILQAGPCDIAVISFVDYSSDAAGTKAASIDIKSTSRSLLAAMIDAISPVDEPSFDRKGAISVRLEPVRSKIRELGRKLVVSSMCGKQYRRILARDLFDAYMAMRAATGKPLVKNALLMGYMAKRSQAKHNAV